MKSKLCNKKITPLSILIILFIFLNGNLLAQSERDPNIPAENYLKKNLKAVKATKIPKIDGNLNDEAWQNAAIAKDFVQNEPKPFATATRKTEIKLMYDNQALYIGAYMYDDPAEIKKELSQRDQIFGSNVDYMTFSLDCYNDDQNGVRFCVSASGVQADAKIGRFDQGNGNSSNSDFSWDAVWESAVAMQTDGWTVEMRIPYSALRFPKKKDQVWGLEFARAIKRLGEVDVWTPLDPKIDGAVIQWGDLTDLKDIEPPLRLALSPYLATSYAHVPTETDANGLTVFGNQKSISGGLDLKYGINEAFTLDATLIPNFGQVQSDNKVLNLSPFEVKYDERRPFFTEGVEMFNKGDIFYSRRVGGLPQGYYDVDGQLKSNEVITKNPSETQLYNATKVSGRTKSKLGIGVFNAVAAPMYATIKDTLSGKSRTIETSPLTNYNVSVFQQTLKNNSEVYFINANTLRNGSANDANVSAMGGRFRDKKNKYQLSMTGKMSNIYQPSIAKSEKGYAGDWSFGKVSGNWTWSFDQSLQTNKWNPNDLGYNGGNNYVNTHIGIQYQQFQPKKLFLQQQAWFNINHNLEYKPSRYMDYGVNAGFWGKFKNQSWVNGWIYSQPGWTYDFYEPRYAGREFHQGPTFNIGLNRGTDERKRLSAYFHASYHGAYFPVANKNSWYFVAGPNFRVNNKLSLNLEVDYQPVLNEIGYATSTDENDITFGKRNRQHVENILGVTYKFTPKMNLTFRARHYWQRVDYKEFYRLETDGSLTKRDWTENVNQNANIFNVDMVYSWQFAPGSFLNLIWKSSVDKFESGANVQINDPYTRNFQQTLRSPQSNNLTLKVIYYLDYVKMKSWVTKN